jgi:hypothetical protein
MATKTKRKTSAGRQTTIANRGGTATASRKLSKTSGARKTATQMNKGMSGASPKPKPVAKPAGGTKTGGGKPAGGRGTTGRGGC